MRSTAIVIFWFSLTCLGLSLAHPFGDPREEKASGRETLLTGSGLPNDARAVLINKCADCHSNETRWPIYSRIAPGAWLIERDIVEARKRMNLSQWNRLSSDEREVLLRQIVHETKENEMPPLQYRVLHWNAKLTPTEIATLSRLSTGTNIQTASSTNGDAAHGKALFDKRCTGCHAEGGGHEGPPLKGVFGRKAGGVAGFGYSSGLRSSGITWNEATLNKWLEAPDVMVPDAKMDFFIPKAQDRADVIAYLKQ